MSKENDNGMLITLPDFYGKEIMTCDPFNGGKPIIRKDIEKLIANFIDLQKEIARQETLLKGAFESILREQGQKSIETDKLIITYTPMRVEKKFKSAKFKKENPELYESYCEETEVKPSIRLTKKKEDEYYEFSYVDSATGEVITMRKKLN